MRVDPASIILEPSYIGAGSRRFLHVMCPVCGYVREVREDTFRSIGHTLCNGCSTLKDLRGRKYGKLLPLHPLPSDNNGGSSKNRKWECLCDCGNVVVMRSHHIQSESIVSCGCYSIERSKRMTGPNSPVWNPDRTDEERRNSRSNDLQYIKWAALVKERDSYTCVVCEKVGGGELVSHHLDAWRDYPDKRYDLDNGVCLCVSCHIEFHSMYGSGWNTGKQFESYKINKGMV